MPNNQTPDLNEVLQLTLQGRLSEATRLIQQTLRGKANFEPRPAQPTDETSSSPGGLGESYLPGLFPNNLSSSSPKFTLPVPDLSGSQTTLPGKFTEGSFSNSSGARHYKLYIPSEYRGQPLPLVVMLHGCTQSPDDFATGTGMNSLAEEHTFLVVYPEQVASANSSKCWNWFQPGDQKRDSGEPSLIAGITRKIIREYSIVPTRVYIAGMSAGGAMAAIMGAVYPDLYAAVGVHSGLAYGVAQNLPSALKAMHQGGGQPMRIRGRVVPPLILFQGDQDKTVAPVNADLLQEQWLLSAKVETQSISNLIQDVTEESGQVPAGRAYSRFIFQDKQGHVIVEKWLIHQAGHAWSGGNPKGSYCDPKGPNAAAEMWRFFAEHPSREV